MNPEGFLADALGTAIWIGLDILRMLVTCELGCCTADLDIIGSCVFFWKLSICGWWEIIREPGRLLQVPLVGSIVLD